MSNQEIEPFAIEHKELKEAIEVLSGTSELQLAFDKNIARIHELLANNSSLLNKLNSNYKEIFPIQQELIHLRESARMMGYPNIFDDKMPPHLL